MSIIVLDPGAAHHMNSHRCNACGTTYAYGNPGESLTGAKLLEKGEYPCANIYCGGFMVPTIKPPILPDPV